MKNICDFKTDPDVSLRLIPNLSIVDLKSPCKLQKSISSGMSVSRASMKKGQQDSSVDIMHPTKRVQ